MIVQTNKATTELATELGRSMSELKNHIRKHIQVQLKEYGINLTFEMLEVMSCLWKKDGVNQQEIADLTLRDKSSMTYLLDNLVKRKMVKRIEDKSDRRNKLVHLTKEGIELKAQLQPWVTEAYEIASAGTVECELQNSLMLVNKMTANLKQE